MKTLTKFVAAAAFFALGAGAASATTVSGIVEENGPGRYYYPGVADHTFRDFSTRTAGPVLTLGGDTTFYGSVQHRDPVRYGDGFTVDFGTVGYMVDFAWQNTRNSPLDFTLTVASAAAGSTAFSSGSDTGTLSVSDLLGAPLTGVWSFLVDPRTGPTDPIENMNWQLSATQIAPVPLPAGALLLLTGLGGIAVLRRRKATAA